MSVAATAISTSRTNDGGGIKLQTTYHNAIILPPGSGTQSAPYKAPLVHYDYDIAALEAHAGREPRWVLPGGKMNFFAPRLAPQVS